jgi:hypothetical protein
VIAPPRIYSATPTGVASCLRQGEIISDLDQFRLDLETIGTGSLSVSPYRHPLALVLTQDCDLEQDFKANAAVNAPDKVVPSVFFCEVSSATEVRGAAWINSTLWKPIPLNKNERYHFLQKVDASCDAQQIGLVELVIDFKRYFTIPTREVYRRIERGEAKRRCVLVSPYLEHLTSRFAYFLSRVALPSDHASD